VFKFITTKPLWVNILVAIVLSVIIIFAFFICLGWITGHGKYVKVPDIMGQKAEVAISKLEALGFRVQVSDSIYSATVPPLTITKQIPEGDALVKDGRTIFLTVNKVEPPKIEMPSLIGFSFKSAQLYLESMGLKLGDTTYRQDFAKNAVLEQLFNNEPMKPGMQVALGSKISFVLGAGLGDSSLNVPDVVGLTFQFAKEKLQGLKLTVGSIVPIGSISDTASAFVVRQNPSIFSETSPGQRAINKTKAGSPIDLYISTTPPIKDSTNTYPK